MNYCGDCGNKLSKNEKFCGNCGVKLSNEDLTKKVEENIKETIRSEQKINKKSDNQSFILKVKEWLFRDESRNENIFYIFFGFLFIPLLPYISSVTIKYMSELVRNKIKFGEFPFEVNFILVYLPWLIIGTPILLGICYLVSLIKNIKIKTPKLFFILTLLIILIGIPSIRQFIRAVNLDKNKVEMIQEKLNPSGIDWNSINERDKIDFDDIDN